MIKNIILIIQRKKKQYGKEFYIDNKQKILEKNKEKITCECGSILRKVDLAEHKRTIKHKELMEQQINKILLFLKCF